MRPFFLAAVVGVAFCSSITPAYSQTLRFAVVGDYGVDNANELAVANRLKSMNPALIVTTGDNNYGSGTAWDTNIGAYYGTYIKAPVGQPPGNRTATLNNFFPSPGNHDWDAGIASYQNYFELPSANGTSGERYFTFTRGPVQFFILSSDTRETDGTNSASVQASWFQSSITASTAHFKLVFFHHPAYTSTGTNAHSASTYMRWDFSKAQAVFQGHNHFYERLSVNGLPYFVSGNGGRTLYGAQNADPNSQFRNDTEFGFMLADVNGDNMTLQSITAGGVVLETFLISVPEPGTYLMMGLAIVSALGAYGVYRRRAHRLREAEVVECQSGNESLE